MGRQGQNLFAYGHVGTPRPRRFSHVSRRFNTLIPIQFNPIIDYLEVIEIPASIPAGTKIDDPSTQYVDLDPGEVI